MKKIIVSVLMLLVVYPLFAQQPSESEEKNVLKVNTLSLIIGTGSIFYERELADNISGQMGVAYLNYNISDTKFRGLILTPEVRFYPRGNAIDGFYVAPYMRYQDFSLKGDGGGEATYSNIGGGILLGRQWVTNSGFTMDLFLVDTMALAKLRLTPALRAILMFPTSMVLEPVLVLQLVLHFNRVEGFVKNNTPSESFLEGVLV